MLKHFPLNEAGRDFVVGDLHGCFSRLQSRLDEIGFNPEIDRLFSVGDLVDRGPESENALEWLNKPWFHAVRGNHEQMVIDYAGGIGDSRIYIANGGAWFVGMTPFEQSEYAIAFNDLPIAIEVETKDGLVGIVHADCPVSDWADLGIALTGHSAESYAQLCMWSRDRATQMWGNGVSGVERVYVGHTPMQQPTSLGNVHYIDTGAVFGRDLTIIQIN